jgi:hypothetical protein
VSQVIKFEINQKVWDEEVFPLIKTELSKCGKEGFGIVQRFFLKMIQITRDSYDPLIILRGFAGSIIDKMNIDNTPVNMFLDYLEKEIANLDWGKITK